MEKLHRKYPKEDLEEYLKSTNVHSLIEARKHAEWDELPMDLDSQLKLEFASYLIHEASNQSTGATNSLKSTVLLQKLGDADVGALKELVRLVRENDAALYSHKSANEDEGKVEQVTSYLISSAISKGVSLSSIDDLANVDGAHDPVLFCKKTVDVLLEAYPDGSGHAGQKQPTPPPTEPETKDIAKQQDLQTAITDLQLAYKFLKSKYESDRDEYLTTIETLNKTNKELSEEILHYHSKLKESEEKAKVVSQILPGPSDTDKSLPTVFSDISDSTGPSTTVNHQSFTMMKQEFKRILADTQLRYEKELQQERELREQIEDQLDNQRYN